MRIAISNCQRVHRLLLGSIRGALVEVWGPCGGDPCDKLGYLKEEPNLKAYYPKSRTVDPNCLDP